MIPEISTSYEKKPRSGTPIMLQQFNGYDDIKSCLSSTVIKAAEAYFRGRPVLGGPRIKPVWL